MRPHFLSKTLQPPRAMLHGPVPALSQLVPSRRVPNHVQERAKRSRASVQAVGHLNMDAGVSASGLSFKRTLDGQLVGALLLPGLNSAAAIS